MHKLNYEETNIEERIRSESYGTQFPLSLTNQSHLRKKQFSTVNKYKSFAENRWASQQQSANQQQQRHVQPPQNLYKKETALI
ncbi:hypothetical protein SESBI_04666 [Sesbania bispinosa]|nr:hypothetical protein SESBI_04666 [Sesbania bispinosa]